MDSGPRLRGGSYFFEVVKKWGGGSFESINWPKSTIRFLFKLAFHMTMETELASDNRPDTSLEQVKVALSTVAPKNVSGRMVSNNSLNSYGFKHLSIGS